MQKTFEWPGGEGKSPAAHFTAQDVMSLLFPPAWVNIPAYLILPVQDDIGWGADRTTAANINGAPVARLSDIRELRIGGEKRTRVALNRRHNFHIKIIKTERKNTKSKGSPGGIDKIVGSVISV